MASTEAGAGATPVRVLITGGSGFLGSMLAERLLAGGTAIGDVEGLVLADIAPPKPSLRDDPRVTVLVGALGTTIAGAPSVDVVFHLAGVVSSAAEADLELGMATNVDELRRLLDWSSTQPQEVTVVFTSSLAVFGDDPEHRLPDVVDDETIARPQSSYGAQKLMGEILVADYARRGLIRARTVRLMTVAVRPGRPNAAASSFLSSIVREPLAGLPAVCPVDLDTPVALSSPSVTVDSLLMASAATDDVWRSPTAVTLPAITTTPRAMLAALDSVTGRDASALVAIEPDAAVAAIVTRWPARFATARAAALGFTAPESIEAIVREHVDLVAPQA